MAESKSGAPNNELQKLIMAMSMGWEVRTQEERLKAQYVMQLQEIPQYSEIVELLFCGQPASLVAKWLFDRRHHSSLSSLQFSGIFRRVRALGSAILEVRKQMMEQILNPELQKHTVEDARVGKQPPSLLDLEHEPLDKATIQAALNRGNCKLDRKEALRYLAAIQLGRVRRLLALESQLGMNLPGGDKIVIGLMEIAIEMRKLEQSEKLAAIGILGRMRRWDQIGPYSTTSAVHDRGATEATGEAHSNRIKVVDIALLRSLMKAPETDATHPTTAQTQQEAKETTKKSAR